MRTAALLFIAAAASASATACQRDLPASSPPPQATPAGMASRQSGDDPARALTPDECDSLGQWIVDDCQNRSNERSAQVDGWCSDMIHGVDTGSWTKNDCAKHIKYMDYVCFRSTKSVHSLMDCDGAVARP